MSNTKIVVLQKKELIYTGIFATLAVLLILLFVIMFHTGQEETEETTAQYIPGIYSTQLTLNDTLLNLEVVVDKNHVNSLSIVNIDESVSAMYPLLEPTIEDLEAQLSNNVPIEEIKPAEENKYTQALLLDTVEELLKGAEAK